MKKTFIIEKNLLPLQYKTIRDMKIIKDSFTSHGVYLLSMFDLYEIEISADGSCARYRYSCMEKLVTRGKWQEIRYTLGGEPYIVDRSRGRNIRLHIDKFIRL